MGGGYCKSVKSTLFSVFFLALLLLCTTFISCAGGAGSAPGGADAEEASLAIHLPDTSRTLYNKADIVSFTVTVSSGSFNSTKTANRGETILFAKMPVGTYNVKAYGKTAGGAVAAKCETSVKVVAGETTTTTLHLSRIDHWTVTFYNGMAVVNTEEISDGYTVAKPANPTKEGHKFSFWAKGEDEASATSSFDFNSPITGETKLFAKYDIKSYNVTFNYNGGKIGSATSTTKQITYNTTPDVSELNSAITRTAADGSNYNFLGWAETDDAASAITLPVATDEMEGKTYYAVWTPKVTVTFDYNGGTYGGNNSTVSCPDKDNPPTVPATSEEPTRDGFKFKGWSSDSSATVADNTVSSIPVSADTTYYAVWLTAYPITYSSGPTIDTSSEAFSGKLSYAVDELPFALPTPTAPVEGLTFVGWYEDGRNPITGVWPGEPVPSIPVSSTGAKEYHARWQTTATFDARNGSTPTTVTVDYGDKYSETIPSSDPEKSHAVFLGWTGTSDGSGSVYTASQLAQTFTEPKTFYAKWDTTEITWDSPVTLPADYTSATGAYKYYDSGMATLPRPEYTGLTFVDWYEDADFTPAKKVTSIPSGTKGDKTFYAKWEATVTIKEYKENTAYPDSPAIGTPQTVVYGKKATKPSPNPTTSRSADGFSDFLGWQTDDENGDPVDFDFTTEITKDITVYGKWKGPLTSFEGTAAQFLAAKFLKGNTAATAYDIKITSATEAQIKQIAKAIGLSTDSNYKGGVYMNLDLSKCSVTTIGGFNSTNEYAGTGPEISTYLTGITLPSSLKTIDSEAFRGCSGLTSITIPEGVEEIYSQAFRGCSGLTSISFPAGVKYIGQLVVSGCSGLSGTTISVPSSVTEIYSNAFKGCNATISIESPSGWNKYAEPRLDPEELKASNVTLSPGDLKVNASEGATYMNYYIYKKE